MDKERQKRIAQALLDRYGQTIADAAGIVLKNTPSPLYQLLVGATLSAGCANAQRATQGIKALLEYGLRTPQRMCESSWEQRTEILERCAYGRNGERVARMLGQSAYFLENRYDGDLRELRERAGRIADRELELLREFRGVDEGVAHLFMREAQVVWQEIYPFADQRATKAAEALGLPKSAKALAALTEGPQEAIRLLSALGCVEVGNEAQAEALQQSA